MIELIQGLPDNVVAFSAKGEVTADDYESILIPAVEKIIKEQGKVRLLYFLGPDFTGYSAKAMWEDEKVGLHHLAAWEKVALVSDVKWVRGATKFFGFMMPGRVRVFTNDQLSEAKDWISS